jgi:glycosyltransferase involved in cell wall biosynthesis
VKVLWISNAPWMPSGYGSQTRQVGRRIAGAGYDIEFVANDGTRGDQEWEGLLVRGSGSDRYSRDSVREDLERSGADWVVSLYDAWVYTEGRKDPFEGMANVAGWVPVDHWPAPISLYPWLENGHMAIAMSRFGQEWLTKLSDAWRGAGKQPFKVRYAPHAVDDVFAPTEADFRQRIGVPADAFLVGIVAANYDSLVHDRKGMSDMAAALGIVADDHQDIYIYVHSIIEGPTMLYLPGLFAFNGVSQERARFADQYALKKQQYSDADMAAMYSSFDVLLATSRGEGFCVPVIEAQACGTPVIASNWTAQAELLDKPWSMDEMGSRRTPSGWLVAVDPLYDGTQGANWGKPFIGQIAAALREAYNQKGDPNLRDAAIAKASLYRADRVFDEHWRPILAEMEQSLEPIPMSRAARRRAERGRRKVPA